MNAIWLVSFLLLQAPDSGVTRIGIDQKLGARVDASIQFRDETGTPVHLGDFFGTKPIVLTPVYFGCPMLCSMELNGLVRALRVMRFTPGDEFQIITFSFDPTEGPGLASAKKEQYLRDYGKAKARDGWHFLTGDDASIKQLTDEIGFRYTRDESINQWAHAAAVIVLTPDGRIAQYFYGIEQDPGDLKLSLVQASGGKIGSFVDRAVLFCYQYDAHAGKFSLAILRIVRMAGVVTVLAIVGFIVMNRAGRKHKDTETQRHRGIPAV
jgi:protein SCO1/2